MKYQNKNTFRIALLCFAIFFLGSICASTAHAEDYSLAGKWDSRDFSKGDGTSSTLQNPEHVYSQAGAYLVEMAAINQNGQSAPAQLTITANPVPPPTAAFSDNEISDYVPLL
jgi:PKD repeat protein